jgi:hypothetical protein
MMSNWAAKVIYVSMLYFTRSPMLWRTLRRCRRRLGRVEQREVPGEASPLGPMVEPAGLGMLERSVRLV